MAILIVKILIAIFMIFVALVIKGSWIKELEEENLFVESYEQSIKTRMYKAINFSSLVLIISGAILMTAFLSSDYTGVSIGSFLGLIFYAGGILIQIAFIEMIHFKEPFKVN